MGETYEVADMFSRGLGSSDWEVYCVVRRSRASTRGYG
jgi:hypothetical protein